jgi:hypothetical protein
MAITQDAVSADQSQGAAGSLTFSHTCAGLDRLLLVCIAVISTTSVSSVTYAGVAMTRAIYEDGGLTTGGQSQIWYLAAPTLGTNNVVITWSFALAGTKKAKSISFTGVDQTTPIAHATSASSALSNATSSNLSVTSAAGDLVLDAMTVGQSSAEAPTPGGSQTQITSFFGSGLGLGVSSRAGASSVSMSWSWTTAAIARQTALSIQHKHYPGDIVNIPLSVEKQRAADLNINVTRTYPAFVEARRDFPLER